MVKVFSNAARSIRACPEAALPRGRRHLLVLYHQQGQRLRGAAACSRPSSVSFLRSRCVPIGPKTASPAPTCCWRPVPGSALPCRDALRRRFQHGYLGRPGGGLPGCRRQLWLRQGACGAAYRARRIRRQADRVGYPLPAAAGRAAVPEAVHHRSRSMSAEVRNRLCASIPMNVAMSST